MLALRTQRVQTVPRIAVHKLGLYTTANARQRRAIVKDQKRPREFSAMRYFDAREAMIDHLLDGEPDPSALFLVIEYLASGYLGSTWASQNAALCIEALSHFLKWEDYAPWNRMKLERGPESPPPVDLCGVWVDVQPDIILRGQNRNGRPIVGALKLHLSKTQPLDPEAGQNIATMLHHYANAALSRPGESASTSRCMVWDVFSGKIHTAPRAGLNRIHVMKACCEEIAFRWQAT